MQVTTESYTGISQFMLGPSVQKTVELLFSDEGSHFFSCVHNVCVCVMHAYACGGCRLMSEIINCSSTLFTEAGALNQNQSSPIHQFALGILVSTF